MKKDRKEKKLQRSPSSFRLRTGIAEIIRKASDESGMSEAQIVDLCVIGQIDGVVRQAVAEAEALKKPTTVTALVGAITDQQNGELMGAMDSMLQKTVRQRSLKVDDDSKSGILTRKLDAGVQHTARVPLRNRKKNLPGDTGSTPPSS